MDIWSIFFIMSLLVLVAVLWPLLRRPPAIRARQAYDMAIYKDQLLEIGRDLERGVIDEARAKSARTEISRQILALEKNATQVADTDDATGSGFRTVVGIAALILVPAIGFGAYMKYGSPDLPGKPYKARISSPGKAASLDVMVARVEDHLRKNPDDAQGWKMLAPSYMRLRRYPDAINAFQKVIRIEGPSADILSNLGEALVLNNQGVVSEDARKVFADSLRRNPAEPMPKYYLGLADLQAGRKDAAIKRWQDMLNKDPADAPWRSHVESIIKKEGGKVPKSAAQPQAEPELDIGKMVSGLAAKLEKDPDNLDRWLMLARSYIVMGKKEEAIKALAKAEKHFAGNPDALKRLKAARSSFSIDDGAGQEKK